VFLAEAWVDATGLDFTPEMVLRTNGWFVLALHARAETERFANFSLAQPDDQRLTDWIHRQLRLALQIKPPGVELGASKPM
jgi:hypothetical protein